MMRLRSPFLVAMLLLSIAGCRQAEPPPTERTRAPATAKPPASRPARSEETVQDAATWRPILPTLQAAQIPRTLRQAGQALDAGLLERGASPGPGALELYLAVLAIEPENAKAREGLHSTLDAMLERGRGSVVNVASALAYAAKMPDLVATVVANYPLTSFIKDPADFIARTKVPVLMLAGTADTYKDCCLIEKARQLAEAAKATSPPILTLHEYQNVGHGYNLATAASKDQPAGIDARLNCSSASLSSFTRSSGWLP